MNISAEATQVTNLARLVDCFDEEGFAQLAGVKLSTLDAWRKRGKGPEYILLGRNYLYPIAAVQKHISRLVRARAVVAPHRVLM
jgi:predicted site-specific integrase-resolvase